MLELKYSMLVKWAPGIPFIRQPLNIKIPIIKSYFMPFELIWLVEMVTKKIYNRTNLVNMLNRKLTDIFLYYKDWKAMKALKSIEFLVAHQHIYIILDIWYIEYLIYWKSDARMQIGKSSPHQFCENPCHPNVFELALLWMARALACF